MNSDKKIKNLLGFTVRFVKTFTTDNVDVYISTVGCSFVGILRCSLLG